MWKTKLLGVGKIVKQELSDREQFFRSAADVTSASEAEWKLHFSFEFSLHRRWKDLDEMIRTGCKE